MTEERALDLMYFHPSSLILYPFSNGFDIFQQRVDALGLLFDRVAHEVKRRSMPQIQRKSKLLAYIGRRVTQRAQGCQMLLFVALHGDIDAGIPEIVGHPHFGHGYQCQARVFEFITHNLRNLFAQGLGDALRAMHDKRQFRVSGLEYSRSDWLESRNSKRETFLEFRSGDLFDHVILDLVADFDVVKVFQPDAAFKALTDLRRVILETAQRSNVALP
jgi:hypothetical protein